MFHIHTYRCGHASKDKEIVYIEKAIENGALAVCCADGKCEDPSTAGFALAQDDKPSDFSIMDRIFNFQLSIFNSEKELFS